MSDASPSAGSFPAATRAQWRALVEKSLKDRPFESLTRRTRDGIAVEPLYERAVDGRTVFARGGPWEIAQRIELPDPAAANAEALHELANGATGLVLVFKNGVGARGFGLDPSAAAIEAALQGVHLDAGIGLELDAGADAFTVASIVAGLVERQSVAASATRIRFGLDPLGAQALGQGPNWAEAEAALVRTAAALSAQGFTGPLIAADGRVIHDSGGSEVQELAFVLACAVAYLRALEAGGVALDAARGMIGVRLAADADQFLTIAKFRAMRLLWARVETLCGLEPTPLHVSAETAWRMTTRRDPWVNMLRGTIAAFSAGIGGADAVTVLPFTTALGLPDRFARRTARNTQLLLLEESHLARVNDPAAGSGAFEALTGELCRTAWSLFQEIESAGGVAAQLSSGALAARVAKTRTEREAAVARRSDSLIGTSDYPNLAEAPVTVLAPMSAIVAVGGPLAPMRLAEPFERLRDASDRALAETGARPRVFLANLGAAADFTARSQFAASLFEAGGIEAVRSDAGEGATDLAALVEAFRQSRTSMACLCSSDEVYARDAADAAAALKAAGLASLYLAGRPTNEAPLRAAGIDAFIHAGCDALATLRAAYDRIGPGGDARKIAPRNAP